MWREDLKLVNGRRLAGGDSGHLNKARSLILTDDKVVKVTKRRLSLFFEIKVGLQITIIFDQLAVRECQKIVQNVHYRHLQESKITRNHPNPTIFKL